MEQREVETIDYEHDDMSAAWPLALYQMTQNERHTYNDCRMGGWNNGSERKIVSYESTQELVDHLLANGVVVLKDESAPPCRACNHGWGSASADGIKTCEESCLELREYAKRKGGGE